MMDPDPLRRSHVVNQDHEPVLFRPVAQLRSPIVERCSTEPRPPDLDPDRPSLAIPPVRALIRPVIWAILPALPVVTLVGWQPALIVGVVAAVIRDLDIRIGRATFSFGDGFLPFRAQNAWPRGVQEEDRVHWNWSPPGSARSGHGGHG